MQCDTDVIANIYSITTHPDALRDYLSHKMCKAVSIFLRVQRYNKGLHVPNLVNRYIGIRTNCRKFKQKITLGGVLIIENGKLKIEND